MAKGYWVAFADVNDPEGYKAYIAENAKAFRKYGGRFLTRGGKSEAPEGKPRSRAVVIEFPTLTRVRGCNGPEARQIANGFGDCRRLRRPSTYRWLVLRFQCSSAPTK